jgi:hypothetical protein
MRVSPRKFLTVAVAGSLAATLVWRPSGVDEAPAPLPNDVGKPAPAAVGLRGLAKRKIARDVAAGRWSLVEAAALFGELNRLPPGLPAVSAVYGSRLPAADCTDEEHLCRQVVNWVDSTLKKETPDRAEEVTARLVAEYQELRRRSGVVHLPDPSTLEPIEDLLRHARASIAEQDRRHTAPTGPPPATH